MIVFAVRTVGGSGSTTAPGTITVFSGARPRKGTLRTAHIFLGGSKGGCGDGAGDVEDLVTDVIVSDFL